MDQIEIPLEHRHLGVPSGSSKMISKPIYVWWKPCNYLALTLTPSPNGANEIPHVPHHLGVPAGASKMIFQAYVTFGANDAPILRLD